jgi:hypothetical protein
MRHTSLKIINDFEKAIIVVLGPLLLHIHEEILLLFLFYGLEGRPELLNFLLAHFEDEGHRTIYLSNLNPGEVGKIFVLSRKKIVFSGGSFVCLVGIQISDLSFFDLQEKMGVFGCSSHSCKEKTVLH